MEEIEPRFFDFEFILILLNRRETYDKLKQIFRANFEGFDIFDKLAAKV